MTTKPDTNAANADPTPPALAGLTAAKVRRLLAGLGVDLDRAVEVRVATATQLAGHRVAGLVVRVKYVDVIDGEVVETTATRSLR